MLKLHVPFLLRLNKILNYECDVRCSSKIDVTTPDNAVASATTCLDLIATRRALYRNILIFLLSPSTKNARLSDKTFL